MLLARETHVTPISFEAEIALFFRRRDLPVSHFVEWETLPYDSFSPHQDIVSQRSPCFPPCPAWTVASLSFPPPPCCSACRQSTTLPRARSTIQTGQTHVERQAFIDSMAECGYLRVPQVDEHGEFAVRGSLLDIFPMGSDQPLRIDFFDDEIESLRWFDAGHADLQRQAQPDPHPARARDAAGQRVRAQLSLSRYRERFEGQPSKSRVYRDVSEGIAHGGIEYYLPMFFEETAAFVDYLPDNCTAPGTGRIWQSIVATIPGRKSRNATSSAASTRRRPILRPAESFLQPGRTATAAWTHTIASLTAPTRSQNQTATVNVATRLAPAMKIEARYEDAAASLLQFLDHVCRPRVVHCGFARSPREHLRPAVGRGLEITRVETWQDFVDGNMAIGVATAHLWKTACYCPRPVWRWSANSNCLARSRSSAAAEDGPNATPKRLSGSSMISTRAQPVVHEEYGVGRYLGLVSLETGGVAGEFLHSSNMPTVTSYTSRCMRLQLISRYTGASPENAPLHRLGSDQWDKGETSRDCEDPRRSRRTA